ncbi:MAG: threonine--tRNA ligase, partial [Deltaproteobacteria bacterium]|nr:threonine--tRNA ligase [Deltaproteobacteria bacterium]
MSNDHDHRLIGQRQDLFHLQEEAPGAVFWHPRGWTLLRILEHRVRLLMEREGFQEVRTPQVLAAPVWQASGHLEHFAAGMFKLEDEGRLFALKPASCPGHIQVALRAALSYRDLPYRLGEFGLVHRNEPSGAVQGLFRLRQFTQDDGHIFCRPEQVFEEVAGFCHSLRAFYAEFGFEKVEVGFSTRPQSRVGSDQDWDRAERVLEEAARKAGIELALQPGQGAFYGPKLEFSLRDRMDRAWQCGTIQLDLAMPERFGLDYVEAGGERRRPALLHRAVFGSLERFLGVLLEHHSGCLAPWLAPEQVVVAPIADAQGDYAREVGGLLRRAGLRVRVDTRGESVGRKVRDAHGLGVPLMV